MDDRRQGKRRSIRKLVRPGDVAMTLRIMVLLSMITVIVFVGLLAQKDSRGGTDGSSSSAGPLTVDLVSGEVLKNGATISGSYNSPKAVNVYYVITAAGDRVIGSGNMALDSKSRFSRNVVVDTADTSITEGVLQVYTQTKTGEHADTIKLPVRLEL